MKIAVLGAHGQLGRDLCPRLPGTVVPLPPQAGPNDLVRLVDNVRAAFSASGLAEPRRPWLDTLADVYDLAKVPQSRTDTDLVVGVTDIPDEQRQGTVSFRPDLDGNMASSRRILQWRSGRSRYFGAVDGHCDGDTGSGCYQQYRQNS